METIEIQLENKADLTKFYNWLMNKGQKEYQNYLKEDFDDKNFAHNFKTKLTDDKIIINVE